MGLFEDFDFGSCSECRKREMEESIRKDVEMSIFYEKNKPLLIELGKNIKEIIKEETKGTDNANT